jgi:hypothetical protein
MKITIEAENDTEREFRGHDGQAVFPMTFLMVRRFVVTGQSVAGDIDWYEGDPIRLFGDIERIKRIIDFRVERMKYVADHK